MARAPRLPQGGPSIFDDDELERSLAGPGEASARTLIVEGDGGSRGNPGPAAYGALVYDAATG